ncbi:uncharacterized protein CEXT_751211 [Caerostris extrusa]|uniref:Uncharacterized protein n=1 Tax=Caerostris extrusa TaxID=172846 RepID=A0AAV4W4V7_CAEEX|nr:uncharacterized protein CEXT_751211 [Caerostris extrusa]
MSKPVKKKDFNNPITIQKIYKTIQGGGFLQELWWELISDIKEKPTYLRLKNMVDDIIQNTVDDCTNMQADRMEESRVHAALSEVSIMAYAVDTIISQVLYRKFQNGCKSIVTDLIKDRLNEMQGNSDIPEDSFIIENIQNILKSEENNESDSLVDEERESSTSNASTSQIIPNVENGSATARKRGRPKKEHLNFDVAEHVDSLPKKKRGRPRLNTDINIKEENVLQFNITSKPYTNEALDNSAENENFEQESDAESVISTGNFSIDSVSSVHTSELSSYDDNLSICSDEGEKIYVPLKIANEMIHLLKKSKESINVNDSSSSASSPSRKILPKRIRKPNSKYSSETMYCEMKRYSVTSPDSASSNSYDEIDNLLTKAKLKTESSEILLKNPMKHYGLDLYKLLSIVLEIFVESATNVMKEGMLDRRGCESSALSASSESTRSPVLGLIWDKNLNALEIDTEYLEFDEREKITKRKILSLVSRLFDPIGFLALVMIQPKILLQTPWKEKESWDEEVNNEIKMIFLKWRKQLKYFKNIKIPRWLDVMKESNLSIHTFVDAIKKFCRCQ